MTTTWTIDRVREALAAKKISAGELAGEVYKRIEARNPELNPYLAVAPDRVPGGSSGGSAAGVAAGLAVAALGTDTGGSIRQPGALCGIPAMMGSYGRVSRYGLIAFASSLDRIGPLATNVGDVAAILQVIAGRDPHDSTSTTAPVPDYRAELKKPVKGLRLGIPKEYFGEGMDAGVRQKIEAGIAIFKKLGCELV